MTVFRKSEFAGPTCPSLQAPEAVQHAALCHRDGPDGPEILMITSSHGRWILPKGWPIDGLGAAETAVQEAWEEAGVKGAQIGATLGSFTALKQRDNGAALACLTTVHAVRVAGLAQDYPEADRRDRRWVPLSQATSVVDEPGLVEVIRRFARIYGSDAPAPEV